MPDFLISTTYSSQAPIGIFDSGIGGLSVLRHIRELLPNESLYYFADSGFAPYGDKSVEEIRQRTLFAVQKLLQQGVKAIVVACNTATVSAMALLRTQYPDLILVGVEPGLKPASSLSKTARIGVLATSRTLASKKYQQLCKQIQQTARVRFINQACPGLVTQIELGKINSEVTSTLLKTYLQPIFEAQADTIVLGCTHYPFIENSIKRIAIEESQHPIQLIDTGLAIARQLQRLLSKNLLANKSNAGSPIHCITSGNLEQLTLALTKLLHFHPKDYSLQKISTQEIGCNLPVS